MLSSVGSGKEVVILDPKYFFTRKLFILFHFLCFRFFLNLLHAVLFAYFMSFTMLRWRGFRRVQSAFAPFKLQYYFLLYHLHRLTANVQKFIEGIYHNRVLSWTRWSALYASSTKCASISNSKPCIRAWCDQRSCWLVGWFYGA